MTINEKLKIAIKGLSLISKGKIKSGKVQIVFSEHSMKVIAKDTLRKIKDKPKGIKK